MTSGALIDRFKDEILQFTGKYFKLSHHSSALSQGLTKEAMGHFKNMCQLLRKKGVLFISPSAAARFICRDKAFVTHKQKTFIEMHFSSISSQAAQL